MGNEIGKKYTIPETHTGTAGHCQLYKLFPVSPKEGRREELTLWLMQKDDLVNRPVGAITDKTTLERLYQVMRKDISLLKDMNHNGIVKIIDVLEDNKKMFAFVTERILCSLADFLSQFADIPGGNTWHRPYLEPNGTVLESEVSRGLLNVIEGLQYLHNVQKKLHMNISPESIVMTMSGQWKLCSLGFALAFTGNDEIKVASPYFMNTTPAPMRLEPDLRYCAPELTEGGSNYQDIRYATRGCDIFSLGILAYEMFRFNLKLVPEGRKNTPPITMYSNTVNQHYEALHGGLRSLDLASIPPGFSHLLSCMLQEAPSGRVTLLEMTNNPFFNSGTLATLRSVDQLYQRDMGTQASILSSLVPQLAILPPRVLECAILPGLCKLTHESPIMWNYTMPVHIYCAGHMDHANYQRAVVPSFVEGMTTDIPETIQAFIRNMDHLRASFDLNFFREAVVPLICFALDKPLSSLQVLTMQCLCDENVYAVIDMPIYLSEIIPRVCKAACKHPDLPVKVSLQFDLFMYIHECIFIIMLLNNLK